eukprot:6492097-Amphidinium_carterae.1
MAKTISKTSESDALIMRVSHCECSKSCTYLFENLRALEDKGCGHSLVTSRAMADLFDLFTAFDGKAQKRESPDQETAEESHISDAISSRSSSPDAKRARVLKNPVMVKLMQSCRVARDGPLTWVNMLKHAFGDSMSHYLEQHPLVHLQTACSGTGCAHIALQALSFHVHP